MPRGLASTKEEAEKWSPMTAKARLRLLGKASVSRVKCKGKNLGNKETKALVQEERTRAVDQGVTRLRWIKRKKSPRESPKSRKGNNI